MTSRKPQSDEGERLGDSIIGTWLPQWSVGDGEPTSAEDLRGVTLTFLGGRCEVRRGGNLIRLGMYTADATNSPHTLDVCFSESDVPELIGATLRGIYEVDADQLRICYGPPGGNRARAFSGNRGTEQYLAEYRRI